MLLFECGKSIAEISWPAYKKEVGGTCDFMTTECSKYCKLKTNIKEQKSYFEFRDSHYQIIVDEIIKEMKELEASILSWWIGSGDCPKELTAKVLLVMGELNKIKITQNGFTRNKKLWENITPEIKLCLTIENENIDEFQAFCDKPKKTHLINKLVAIPNYKTQRVKIQKIINIKQEKHIGCGYGWATHYKMGKTESAFVEDCSLCLRDGVGCYSL